MKPSEEKIKVLIADDHAIAASKSWGSRKTESKP